MEVVLNSEIELMVYIMRRHHVEWDGDIKRPLNDTKFPVRAPCKTPWEY